MAERSLYSGNVFHWGWTDSDWTLIEWNNQHLYPTCPQPPHSMVAPSNTHTRHLPYTHTHTTNTSYSMVAPYFFPTQWLKIIYINFKRSSSGKPSSVILLPREQHQPFWYGHWTLVIRQRIFQIFINWVNYLFDEDCCVSGEGRQDSDPLFSMLMTLQVFSLRNRILMF